MDGVLDVFDFLGDFVFPIVVGFNDVVELSLLQFIDFFLGNDSSGARGWGIG